MTVPTAGTAAEARGARAASRARIDAAITFAGLMVTNVLGYAFYALVSRTLGVEAYGTFAALVALVMILQAPALIAQIVVAKLASDVADQPDRLAGLVHAVDRVTLLVASGIALALIAASAPLAGFLHVAEPLLVALAGLALFGAVALPFLRGVLQGTSAFGPFVLSNIAEGVGKALFSPLLGFAGGVRGAVAGVAIGYTAAAFFTYLAGRAHRHGTRVRFPVRSVLRTSGTVAVAVFAINVLLFYDVVLAKRYLDAHAAGLYGAAALASRALYALIAFVPTVLLPQVARSSARGERTRSMYAQAIGVAALLGIAAVAFFALFPRFVVVTIAGRSFAGAAPLVVVYVYAIAALALANVTATYNIARGRMAFVAPLLCIAVGEITAVVLRHRSASDLLQTIAVGHTLAVLACAVSLGRSRPAGATGA